jgi:predicted 5'-methylthioadenosine/S-adenosylhomocysteine nucleosidase
MDASPLGFPKGETPFLGLPATLPLPLRIPGIPEATLSTGGNIISGVAGTIAEDMVDMETYACAPARHSACWSRCVAFRTARPNCAMWAIGPNICM